MSQKKLRCRNPEGNDEVLTVLLLIVVANFRNWKGVFSSFSIYCSNHMRGWRLRQQIIANARRVKEACSLDFEEHTHLLTHIAVISYTSMGFKFHKLLLLSKLSFDRLHYF